MKTVFFHYGFVAVIMTALYRRIGHGGTTGKH